ncbi:MAG: NnrU family protein [bacterium]
MEYCWLALAWIAWSALHSTMIDNRVTTALRRRLGASFRFYRLFFNLVSLVTLVPVVLYGRSLDSPVFWRVPDLLFVVQLLLLALALWLFVAGGRHYDFLQFLGFRQISSGGSSGALTESGALNTRGLLGVTRHPWYLGALLFVWSYPRELTVAHLVVKGVLTVYIIVGTVFEEHKLVAEYGDAYRQYQRDVSMLLPWKLLGGKTRKY